MSGSAVFARLCSEENGVLPVRKKGERRMPQDLSSNAESALDSYTR